MNNMFRADHVGSLLRPAEFIAARRDGTSLEKIRTVEENYILRVLRSSKNWD